MKAARKQAADHEALRSTEHRYQILADASPDLMFSFDREMVLIAINRAAAASLRADPRELVGKHITQLGLPDALSSRWQLRCGEILRSGLPAERLLNEFTLADGQRHLNETSLFPSIDANGQVVGVRGATRDVTEVRQAEELLRISEQRYRTLFDSASDGIVVHDLDGSILEANSALRSSLGLAPQEPLGLSVADVCAPEAAVTYMAEIEQLQNRGRLVLEMSLMAGNGTLLPVEVTARFVESAGQRVVMAIFRDISERKQAESALRTSQAQLEAAMDLAGLVNWEFDVTSGVFTFSDRFYALYGTTAEIEGGHEMPAEVYASRFLHPDERHVVANEVEKAIETSDPDYRAYMEHRIVRRGGEIRNIVVRYAITKDEHGRTVKTHGANQDVTERKRIEEALAQAEEQLRQAQKMEAIGQLAGGIAHDFNNLLTVVVGSASLLLEDMLPDDPRRKLISDIKDTGDRAANLTRQILAFSRRQVLRPEVLSLNEVVGTIRPLLRRTLGEDIDLVYSLATDLALTEVDPAQMEQVLMNLAVNARDAMPGGGRLAIETANVTLDAEYVRVNPWVEPGIYVMLAVSDTGCGMDAATVDRVFEPFFTTKEPGRGTGLGLSTVYGIVKQSGGSIAVQSEPGHGSAFRIYLPVAQRAASARERHGPETQASRGGTETILMVEDEAGVRELLVQVLARAGYRVHAFGSWGELVAQIDRQEVTPDLLLTDVVLPEGVDGRAVAERMRERYPGLLVLFMSGYTRQAMTKSGRLDSDVDFLQKPFEPQTLVQKVRDMLDAPGTRG